jgi:hypothetical protein
MAVVLDGARLLLRERASCCTCTCTCTVVVVNTLEDTADVRKLKSESPAHAFAPRAYKTTRYPAAGGHAAHMAGTGRGSSFSSRLRAMQRRRAGGVAGGP